MSREDAELRRQSRTNLLDLKTDFAFWNPDLAPADPARPPVDLDTHPGPQTGAQHAAGQHAGQHGGHDESEQGTV